jgi:dienelactone hydrolase
MPLVRWSWPVGPALLVVALLGGGPTAHGDTVTLKNGIVYRGIVDRDNTIVFVFDGLKRIVLRDSKIEKIESDASTRNLERFSLVQPLEVHAGSSPSVAYGIESTPWDEFGRRTFSYIGSKSAKPITMKQAINELGPFMVRYRGVDGFWPDGKVATGQVPRDVVLGLLGKVEQTNQNERLRVGRFLIQAEWYAEARKELDRLEKDFPDLRERVQSVRQSVAQLEAEMLLAEIAVRRKALQPKEVMSRLKAFPSDGVSIDLLTKVREQLRQDEAQVAADKTLADSLQSLAGRLSDETQGHWKAPLVEMLAGLAAAPDAARPRLEAFQKAESAASPEARFALALTGWLLGPDAALSDLTSAEKLWKARDLIGDYLRSPKPEVRDDRLETLQAVEWADDSQSIRKMDPETATRLARLMVPPLRDDKTTPGQPQIFQVLNDDNEAPTEYAVLLPPEYHPLRSYPAILALHSGKGKTSADRMRGAIAWWAAEATRRGYIVIAPEYNLPGQAADYRYQPSEHAAAELALRDAKRRFAIDSDRVFLGGQLLGGNMAWDFGLAHPDLFAGIAIVSGLPAKYVDRHRVHAERVPLYIAVGDLAPAVSELVFVMAKAMIAKTYDVTYVEYFRRGLEDLPEEAPAILEWMDHHRSRDPYPRKFDAVAARDCDNRFYGVVIREFAPGRTTEPGAVEPLGKNLNPATIEMTSSALSNLIKVNANGVRKLDVWVSPKLVDFKKRVEVRINGKAYFKGPVKPDIEPFLEDLRIRGDRQQVYWLKVAAG